MKLSTLSSLFVLMSVVSLIAIAPSAFAAHHEVTIENAPGSSTPGCEPDCFIPTTATVEVGAIVTWSNTDNAAHTATAGSAADGPSGVFDSSLIMAGGSYSYTADTAGTFDYFCMVHPWMEGTLIVEAAGAADAAAAEAQAAAAAAAAAAADAAAAQAAATAAMAAPSIDAEDYITTSGVSVTSITANADDDSVIIAIDAEDDGVLSVTLHSKVITAFDDGTYFVLINNEEVEFEQSGNSLTIPYEAGNEKVEIVGSHAVPEFGTIAMIILAVAIVTVSYTHLTLPTKRIV